MKNRLTLTSYRWLRALGADPRVTLWGLREMLPFWSAYGKISRAAGPDWSVKPSSPNFQDKHDSAGTAKGHYFHQDLLVAQLIHQRNPRLHVDVGSRVDGFVAHVATFRLIEVIDIRPLAVSVRNMVFRQRDLMAAPRAGEPRCDSLSCLHALEHFGLGRYGDLLDIDGWKKGLRGLAALLQPGGRLYLSVPIGGQRIEFNGHRVFAPQTIVREAEGLGLTLAAFHFVDDAGDLHEQPQGIAPTTVGAAGLHYGCGIFEFIQAGAAADLPR